MNLLKEPVSSSGDHLDDLLRAFFQAEMPSPWPQVEVPSRPMLVVPDRDDRPARSGRASLLRSRFALAASIALLVSGPLFLANVFRDRGPAATNDDGARREAPHIRIKSSLPVTPRGAQEIRVDVELLEDPAVK